MKHNSLKLIIFAVSAILSLNIALPGYSHESTHCDCCTCHDGSVEPKEIKDGTVLTIQDCISIGLKNSPVIKKHKYELDIAKSNVGIAKSVYFPRISAGIGYGHVNNSNNTEFHSLYRELPNIGVSLRQMIWDFGRSNAHIRMEEFYKIGAEYEFMDSVCSTVFDIKTKYYALLRAQSLLNIQRENYNLNSVLISDIKSMIKTGKADNVDLINAETEQYRIQKEIIEAVDRVKNAKEDLNNSMYFLNAPNYSISDTGSYRNKDIDKTTSFIPVSNKKTDATLKIKASKNALTIPDFTYEEAVNLAYKNSPDLKVLEATKNAMEQELLYVKRSFYPELSASVGYGRLSTNHFNNNELVLGVNLSAELNALEVKYGIKGARAQINLAQTEIEKFKEDLYFTVRKAINTVNKSKEQITISKKEVKSAFDNFNLTTDGYKKSKRNQLELLYARNSYVKSMQNYVNTVYSYNIALIDLEIAMHYHLIDIHERTEHAMKYHENEIIDRFDNIMDCDKHDKTGK